MMMKVKFIFILAFLLFNINVFAQKPEFILPGQTKTLSPTNDTLWVLNNKQFKQTIIAKDQLKICNKEIDVYKQMTDTLKAENQTLKEKADLLVQDRDYYIKTWKEAEDNVTLLAKMNKRQTTFTQIAIVAGVITTVAAFFGGYLLKH